MFPLGLMSAPRRKSRLPNALASSARLCAGSAPAMDAIANNAAAAAPRNNRFRNSYPPTQSLCRDRNCQNFPSRQVAWRSRARLLAAPHVCQFASTPPGMGAARSGVDRLSERSRAVARRSEAGRARGRGLRRGGPRRRQGREGVAGRGPRRRRRKRARSSRRSPRSSSSRSATSGCAIPGRSCSAAARSAGRRASASTAGAANTISTATRTSASGWPGAPACPSPRPTGSSKAARSTATDRARCSPPSNACSTPTATR